MKLVAVSKLVVTREQSDALLATTFRVNAARSWLASQAMALPRCDRKSKYTLQRLFYAEMRERFGIDAQLTIRALATVAACFKTDPYAEHTFREKAAISYDTRNLSFGGEDVPTSVSIATLDGRITLPLIAGGPHHDRLAGERGEVSNDDAGNAALMATRVPVEFRRKPHASA